MKHVIFYLACLGFFTSCNSSKFLASGKTYENFRGFEPIDPIEYIERVALVENGEIVFKYPLKLTKKETLSFLSNETVLVSIGQFDADGKISFGPAAFSAKNSNYKVTMDYMKFATIRDTTKAGVVSGYKRVGVGLRIIANVVSLEGGINLGDLFAIGLAAQAKKLSGTLMIEVIGIKSNDVTTILPLPSEINQSTIQTAMQAMATIKSKIYVDGTDLYPQVMAIKSAEKSDQQSFKNQVEKEGTSK